MSFREEAIECLKKSLKDCRSGGSILSLENLMERREKNKDGSPHYRLMLIDKTPITSVDEFIANIKPEDVEFVEVTGTGDRYIGTYESVRLVIRNIYLVLHPHNQEDLNISLNWFDWKLCNLAFTMAYRNDNDPDIKLKSAYVTLYNALKRR